MNLPVKGVILVAIIVILAIFIFVNLNNSPCPILQGCESISEASINASTLYYQDNQCDFTEIRVSNVNFNVKSDRGIIPFEGDAYRLQLNSSCSNMEKLMSNNRLSDEFSGLYRNSKSEIYWCTGRSAI